MAKWCGNIGYNITTETAPGVWEENIVPHKHFGDVTRNTRSLQSADQLNDNVNVSNEISIVADPFSRENFHSMRYIEFMGAKWKITNASVQYPRIVLTIGGLYK